MKTLLFYFILIRLTSPIGRASSALIQRTALHWECQRGAFALLWTPTMLRISCTPCKQENRLSAQTNKHIL